MNDLYTFVYRGQLAEASLDRAGRKRSRVFDAEEASRLRESLGFDFLDPDALGNAKQMSIVYTAVHAFENMTRDLVTSAMAEGHGENWWEKVPQKIRTKVQGRQEQDAKFRYHGRRGSDAVGYCDFGDLSSIIVTNWTLFEDVLVDMNWTKAVLDTLEKSRNIIMHGGILAAEDVERIGMNIRDWIRQVG